MYFGWSKYFDSLLISSISRHFVIVPLTYTNALFLTTLWLIPLARDCRSKHSLNEKGYIYVLNIKMILITLFATCSFLKGYQFQMSSFWQFQYNLKLIITRQLTQVYFMLKFNIIIINYTYSILVLILILKYSTEQIFLKGKQLTKLKFLKQSDYTTTCYVSTLSDASTYRQSAIQSISQLVSWSVTESIRSISELISHLFSQLDNQSGRQPVTQMVSQLIIQPVNQSVSHLPNQSFSWFKSVITQSVFQSASRSVSQSLIQSIIRSVSQNQSVSQAVYQKVSKSMSQQLVLEYSDSQLVLHSQSFSNSKFIHFKYLKILLF